MNILIKLTCLIGLVIAPILGGHTEADIPNTEETSAIHTESGDEVTISKEIKMEKNSDNDFVTAYVVVTRMNNGEEITETFEFEGSELEVRKKVDAVK